MNQNTQFDTQKFKVKKNFFARNLITRHQPLA